MIRKAAEVLVALVFLVTTSRLDQHAIGTLARVEDNSEREDAVASLFTELDANNDGEILEDEAVRFMSSCPDCEIDAMEPENVADAAQKFFSAMESPGDSDNTVSPDELEGYLHDLFPTVSAVSDWITHGVQLPQYVEVFQINGITGADFPYLLKGGTPSVLESELGIKKILHQNILRRAIRRQILGQGSKPGPPRQLTCSVTTMGGVQSLVADWEEPEECGSPPVHKYEAQVKISQAWVPVEKSANHPTTALSADLPPSHSPPSKCRLRAWGGHGCSGFVEADITPGRENAENGSKVYSGWSKTEGRGSKNSEIEPLFSYYVGWISLVFSVLNANGWIQFFKRSLGYNSEEGFRRQRSTNAESMGSNPAVCDATKVPNRKSSMSESNHASDKSLMTSASKESTASPSTVRSKSMKKIVSSLDRNSSSSSTKDRCEESPGVPKLQPLGEISSFPTGNPLSVHRSQSMAVVPKAKICHHPGCEKELRSFFAGNRHFCRRCDNTFCNEHTYPSHSRFLPCKYRSECICHSCFEKEKHFQVPSRTPNRMESKVMQGSGKKHWETARRHIRNKNFFRKCSASGKED